MKRLLAILIIPTLLLLSGCGSSSSSRLNLFNSFNWFGGTPSSVTVSKGDTLYSIARRYNVPLRDVIEANNMKPPYALRIGQTIRLPVAKTHIVEKGDTLYNISRRYGVDVTSLSRTNNIPAPYTLKIGQKLILPGTVTKKPEPNYKAPTSGTTKVVKAGTANRPSATTTKTTTFRKTKFDWPVKGTIISKYGTLGKGRTNDGINIKASLGTAVKAADNGTIAYAGNELKGFGNLILIKHSDGWITAYAHNDKLLVKKGQKVVRGEKISTVGSTGGVNSPQLHFEVRSGKKALDPLKYLP